MPCPEQKSAHTYMLIIQHTDRFQVGAIRWPLWLQDNATNYDYCNDAIQMPLYDAYLTIFSILTGTAQHPIVPLFNQHMEEQHIKFHKWNYGRAPSPSNLLRMAHSMPFSVPIIPGDASLVKNFLTDIKVQAHREKIDIIDKDLILIPLGLTLFHLVILWTYLG